MQAQQGHPARLSVGIVGAGRVGAVLGAALHAAGHRVVATSGLSPASHDRARELLPGVPLFPVEGVVERAELIVLAVPTEVLPDLVRGLATRRVWQAGQIVFHTSARYGIEIFEPALGRHILPLALHPAMRFTGRPADLERLGESLVAVTTTAVLRPVGEALAVEMGAEPVWIEEGQRPRYAAAVAHAADALGILVDQAAELLGAAGVEAGRRLLGTLLASALDAAIHGEAGAAPAAMVDDLGALSTDLEVLHESSPDARAVHLAFARAAASRALAGRGAEAMDVDALFDLLGERRPPGAPT